MEADDVVVVTQSSCACVDGEDDTSTANKENIDPSSSPEDLAPAMDDGRCDDASRRSDSESPSPKSRRKANGKQKAPRSNKKRRMVLQVYSDDE